MPFQQLYWHALLPGRDVPGIGSLMPVRGKRNPLPAPIAAAATKEN
jgi:sulfide:quinone oxidoreductase